MSIRFPYISYGDQLAGRIVDPRLHLIPSLVVRLRNSSNISIPDTTVTALTFDTEDINTGGTGMHSTTVNTGRIMFPIAGIYFVTGKVDFAASAGGTFRYSWIRLNGGGTVVDIARGAPVNLAGIPTLKTAIPYRFASGDYIELIARQDSGGALNALGTTDGSAMTFTAQWVSP